MPNLLIEDMDAWFVWTKTGHGPKFVHHTAASAEAEAERLAGLNPGKKFIVMRAYRKVSVSVPEPVAVEAPAQIAEAV